VVLNTNPANPLGGEIWLMDLSGKLLRRVTQNNYHEEYPKFSPDGNKIVFVRNMGGVAPGLGIEPKHNEIFVYDLRTGAETRLTRNSVEDSAPEWSHNGEQIVFHSRRDHAEEKATLWVMDSNNGSRSRRVISLEPGDLSHTNPDWSPDGQWLTFASHREEGGVRYSRIDKVRLDGSQRTVISSGGRRQGAAQQGPLGDLDPDYSPDGAMIWSSRSLEDGQIRLFAFGANAYYAGKVEKDMNWPVHPDGVERAPRFSPDGRRIALTRLSPKSGHQTHQLVLTDPQSSFRRYLTTREDWDLWHPSWSPSAHSGADREAGTAVESYRASSAPGSRTLPAENKPGSSASSGQQKSEGIRLVGNVVQTSDAKTGQEATYDVAWKLDRPAERVTSLTLRFEGRLGGEKAEEKPLRFQLMDWTEKRWVAVFVCSQSSSDKVKILHEIAPANFISRDKHEVLLRIVALGASPASAPDLEAGYLGLDVRRD
jgi:Tol biopolymer transport system component